MSDRLDGIQAILDYMGVSHSEFYRDHYHATTDVDAKLATFGTSPEIRNLPRNLLCEVIGTFVLVFAVLMAVAPTMELASTDGGSALVSTKMGLGAVGALPVGSRPWTCRR